MNRYYVLTLFPGMILNGLGTSITGRAIEKGTIGLEAINIRDYAGNKHGKVDDYPYGGGAGMVMQAEPVYQAWKAVTERIGRKPRTVYVTPQGSVFHQAMAEEFAKEEDLLLEYPQYSRPEEWHGRRVPEVLLSGHHANVEKWRLEQSLIRTKERRPDLYEAYLRKQTP